MGELNHDDVDSFFHALAEKAPYRIKVILTGGVEAMLLGGTRPTRDIDFGVLPSGGPKVRETMWNQIEQTISDVAYRQGIAVQYAEDIERWSMIALPSYQRHTHLYRRFGRVSVHLLDPEYWAVSKLMRYLDTDITDIGAVLQTQRVPWGKVARICGRALRASPRSSALWLFRRQVEHFFKEYGRKIWGQGFEPMEAIRTFHRTAGIPTIKT
ncbi:MAG: hypothetical protein HY709_09740 [Candidatus Latescibacteria bacterium]|nr:hypothetical protein [Candidatus Latescibacterota bacterium]